ncbi:hypothetical protein MTR67_043158, partial [Solanum verrucosum]
SWKNDGFLGEKAGASRQPARPNRGSDVLPLAWRAHQSASRPPLKFLVWCSAPLRAPRAPSFPIPSPLSHACS